MERVAMGVDKPQPANRRFHQRRDLIRADHFRPDRWLGYAVRRRLGGWSDLGFDGCAESTLLLELAPLRCAPHRFEIPPRRRVADVRHHWARHRRTGFARMHSVLQYDPDRE